MAARGPIRLRVAHQKAYLWDLEGELASVLILISRAVILSNHTSVGPAETCITIWDHELTLRTPADIQYLRVQHHIVGSLQGTLPQVTQQNVFLGLPLVLLPEEAVLLVRNSASPRPSSCFRTPLTSLPLLRADLAVLVDDSAAHLPPTPAQAASYAASRSSAITAQREASLASEAERKALHEATHADEIAAKRRAKENRRRAQAAREQGEGVGVGERTIEVSVPPLREGEATTGPPAAAAASSASSSAPSPLPAPPAPASASRDLSTVPYTVIIEPRSSSLAWYDPALARATYATLESASEAGVWSYPQTPLQEARCRVFEDLWRRGHYMGGGLRFGGDFLVYPGALTSRSPLSLLLLFVERVKSSLTDSC